MNGFPKREIVEMVKTQFPAGTRVELISMEDPFRDMQPGIQGTVIAVDDIATVHIRWDNGSSLGAVYGEDQIRRL